MRSAHKRNHAFQYTLRCADPLRWIMQIARSRWKEALSHAWWCAGVRRTTRKQECAQAWSFYLRENGRTSPYLRLVAAIAQIPCGNKLTDPKTTVGKLGSFCGRGVHALSVHCAAGAYLSFLGLLRIRKRTPPPPPFSSMNSTPPETSARCRA